MQVPAPMTGRHWRAFPIAGEATGVETVVAALMRVRIPPRPPVEKSRRMENDMKRNIEQPKGSEQLRAVVADAYRVFRRHKPPAGSLDVCLGCCMSPELEREMRQLPLPKLTRQHFYEYNTSAKSEVQPADELLYLLPRMLELMTERAEIHHSIELSLDRLGRCPADAFDEAQQRVLNGFALSYFEQSIAASERMWFDEPISLLLMFDIGGLAVAPLLDVWMRNEGPESTMHFVDATYWNLWEAGDYDNAFATDRPTFRSQIRAWMLNPVHRRRFADKLMKPDFQCLADRQEARGHIAFSTMVDAVFDHLTQ
jgi:hypothetical protein